MDFRILNKCWMGFFRNLGKEEKRLAKSSSCETYYSDLFQEKKTLINQACTAQNKAVTNNQNRNFTQEADKLLSTLRKQCRDNLGHNFK